MMWIYTQTKSFFKPSFPKWLTGIWVICKTYVHLTNSHLPGLVDVSFSDGWISPQSSSIFVQVDVSKSALALHPCLGAKKITYRNENWSPRHDHFTLVVQLTSATPAQRLHLSMMLTGQVFFDLLAQITAIDRNSIDHWTVPGLALHWIFRHFTPQQRPGWRGTVSTLVQVLGTKLDQVSTMGLVGGSCAEEFTFINWIDKGMRLEQGTRSWSLVEFQISFWDDQIIQKNFPKIVRLGWHDAT